MKCAQCVKCLKLRTLFTYLVVGHTTHTQIHTQTETEKKKKKRCFFEWNIFAVVVCECEERNLLPNVWKSHTTHPHAGQTMVERASESGRDIKRPTLLSMAETHDIEIDYSHHIRRFRHVETGNFTEINSGRALGRCGTWKKLRVPLINPLVDSCNHS